jgi:hypothetical protein
LLAAGLSGVVLAAKSTESIELGTLLARPVLFEKQTLSEVQKF